MNLRLFFYAMFVTSIVCLGGILWIEKNMAGHQQSAEQQRQALDNFHISYYHLMILLFSREAADRGYLVNQDPFYLAAFEKAMPMIPALVEQLSVFYSEDTMNEVLHIIERRRKEFNTAQAKLNDPTLTPAQQREVLNDFLIKGSHNQYVIAIRDKLVATRLANVSAYNQTNDTLKQLYRQQKWLTYFTGLLFLTLLFSFYLLIKRKLISPLESLTASHKVFAENRHREIALAPVGITEFDQLNLAAHEMSRRIIESETALTENIEKLHAETRARNVFMSNMSHELRTPLNGIAGMLQVLEKELDNEQHRHFVHVALDSTTALTRIITDILDVEKLAAGHIQLSNAWCATHALFDELTLLHRPAAEVKGLSFDIHIDGVPTYLLCDKFRLLQILNHLLGNAIKFTADGGILLQASFTDNHLIVVVKDTGIGIPRQQQEAVFDFFVQGDSSIKKAYAGIGAGLTIARHITALMHGNLELSSVSNVGTTVTLTLPFESQD